MRPTTWVIVFAFVLAVALGLSTIFVVAEPTRATLDADLSQVASEIAAAQADAATYSGGLIFAQIQLRLQTLEATRAMLEQKRRSWLRFIDLSYTVDGRVRPPSSALELAQLQSDVDKLKEEIDQNTSLLSNYNGGLLQVMQLVTIATQRSTLALVEMRYLTAKWGIPLYIPAIANSDATSAPTTNPGHVVEDKNAL